MNQHTQITHIKDWLGHGSLNLFGMPFAGKDTQGEKLARHLGAPLVGGGDILRGSIIPQHVKKIMHDGGLVPIEDYLQIVLPYLGRPEYHKRPLVLSSVGRWHGEETSVIEALQQSEHHLKAVVFLTLDERIIWQRWKASQRGSFRGQRHDDDADALEVRLEEFRLKTKPVIDFYRDLGVLIEIDGSQTIHAVEADIIASLTSLAAIKQ